MKIKRRPSLPGKPSEHYLDLLRKNITAEEYAQKVVKNVDSELAKRRRHVRRSGKRALAH